MIPLFILGLPALAFQPDAHTHIGQEPVRERSVHADLQKHWRSQAPWRGFLSGEGTGWKVVFDEATGTVQRAWGPGILLSGAGDSASVEAALIKLFHAHPALLGIDPSKLALSSIRPGAEVGSWHVSFARLVTGAGTSGVGGQLGGDLSMGSVGVPAVDMVPMDADSALHDLARFGAPTVWRGGAKLTIKQGKLIMFSMDTHPGADQVDLEPTLSAATAIELAVEDGPHGDAAHTVEGATLVVLPEQSGARITYRLCWLVRTQTQTPRGIWVSFVDAHSGELINVHNQVRYLSGSVHGHHDTRTVDGNMSTSAMPYTELRTDSFAQYADADGWFEVEGSGLHAELDGRYFTVRNDDGAEGELDWTDGDAIWTSDDATQAEIDTYVFLHQVREWSELHAPEVPITWDRLRSTVNINSTCNAYFDGNFNFYKKGSGCNNTGRIADVNYHEWGHGFHYSSVDSWWLDGSVSEGAGDIISFLLTGDSTIAPYFMTSGAGIRDVAPDRVYPEDWVGEIHIDGLIFAGAVWDLWDVLRAEMSEDEAYDTTVALFVEAIKSNPEVPDTYDAFLAADDDNGDLGDGTPNQCAIIDAFSRHGLGPAGSDSFFFLTTEALGNQDAEAGAYPVLADVYDISGGCDSQTVGGASVVYSVDGGESWTSVALDIDGQTVEGAIPLQPAGTVVSYYIAVDTEEAGLVSVPEGGPINALSFYVGPLEEILCEDFEDSDGGYVHELLEGEVTEGADDWMWDSPKGSAGDPDAAASGLKVWGNDLGGGNFNGEYQNDKRNRLTSPVIDVAGQQRIVVQYKRWLNVEDGYYDQARIRLHRGTDGSFFDEEIWQNHGSSQSLGDQHHEDRMWAPHTFVVDMEGEDQVMLSWEIQSDGGLTMGGWNLDDVCIYGAGDASTGGDSGVGGDDGGDGGSGDVTADGFDIGLGGCACSGAPSRPFGGALGGLVLMGLALARRREDPIA